MNFLNRMFAVSFVLAAFAIGCMISYNIGHTAGFNQADEIRKEEVKNAEMKIASFVAALNDAAGQFVDTRAKAALYYESAGRYQPHATMLLVNDSDAQTPLIRYTFEGDAVLVQYYTDGLLANPPRSFKRIPITVSVQ
jgi:hypothetical protein